MRAAVWAVWVLLVVGTMGGGSASAHCTPTMPDAPTACVDETDTGEDPACQQAGDAHVAETGLFLEGALADRTADAFVGGHRDCDRTTTRANHCWNLQARSTVADEGQGVTSATAWAGWCEHETPFSFQQVCTVAAVANDPGSGQSLSLTNNARCPTELLPKPPFGGFGLP